MHKTRSNNILGLTYIVTILAFTTFIATGFIPRDNSVPDDFVQIHEYGVSCTDNEGMDYTAHYVATQPQSLAYEIGLCASQAHLTH